MFGIWVYRFTDSFFASAVVVGIVFLICNFVFRPFKQSEYEQLKKLISQKKKKPKKTT